MNKKIIGYGALILCGLSSMVTNNVFAAPSVQDVQGAARQKVIDDVNKAINSIGKLEGNFTQRNPDLSISTGKFYISRPGKMRFEYNAPSALLMVSNGTNVGVTDRRLKNLNQYPLQSTPLYFLLKAKVDIGKELNVTNVVQVGDSYVVYLRDKKKQTQGELRIVFSRDMQLREWAVINQQNQMTYVKLSDVKVSKGLSDKLFVIPDPRNNSFRGNNGK